MQYQNRNGLSLNSICIFLQFLQYLQCLYAVAIGNVFDDNDNVDGGNGFAHEISQKTGLTAKPSLRLIW